MVRVTALQAKNRLGSLLDRVSRGEEIVITREKKPVARLIPETTPPADATGAIDAVFAHRAKFAGGSRRSTVSLPDVRSAREEGRR